MGAGSIKLNSKAVGFITIKLGPQTGEASAINMQANSAACKTNKRTRPETRDSAHHIMAVVRGVDVLCSSLEELGLLVQG